MALILLDDNILLAQWINSFDQPREWEVIRLGDISNLQKDKALPLISCNRSRLKPYILNDFPVACSEIIGKINRYVIVEYCQQAAIGVLRTKLKGIQ